MYAMQSVSVDSLSDDQGSDETIEWRQDTIQKGARPKQQVAVPC